MSAGHLFSMIASARLHGLDPESYLRDMFRVLAHWPKERYLELAPKHWAATRARLDPAELALEIGALTVPKPTAVPPSAPTEYGADFAQYPMISPTPVGGAERCPCTG